MSFGRAPTASVRNVDTIELDLDREHCPGGRERRVVPLCFAFLTRPRDLLKAIHVALSRAPLCRLRILQLRVVRLAPRQPGFEEFVKLVISSWRQTAASRTSLG